MTGFFAALADLVSKALTPEADSTLPPAPDVIGDLGQWLDDLKNNAISVDGDLGHRRFVQARLADYSGLVARLMEPVSAAALLNDRRLASPQPVHVIDPAAVPAGGLAVERRWQLARDTDGEPVLWVGRLRRPLLAPPARRLRHDAMELAGPRR